MTTKRDFLEIRDLDSDTLRAIIDRAGVLKTERASDPLAHRDLMAGRALAMIFEKPSTRTRVSFELAMAQCGGRPVVLSADEMQIGRGETVADTARVLSRYVDAIMLRTGDATKLLELAEHATVPVINGLTELSHPCQIMADVLTFEEYRGPIEGRTVAWVGDCNNVAQSWAEAAARFGFSLRVACPESLAPPADLVSWVESEGCDVTFMTDPDKAVANVDCVVTDAWVSMNHTDGDIRRARLAPYRVDEALMARAGEGAIFMHCLPAHRGDEVTDAVIDGLCSAVWDEAENRIHAQKAILSWCLNS